MALEFKKIPVKESAVQQCTLALQRAILNGELLPGTRLPPERQLAQDMGVNRTTLRGALTHLASLGLLSVRQGSGYEVKDFRTVGGPHLFALLAELQDDEEEAVDMAKDLLMIRRSLASVVLHKLARRASPEAWLRVVNAAQSFIQKAQAGAGKDELIEADLAAFSAILDAAGGPVFRLFFNPVASALRQFEDLRAVMYADTKTNVQAYNKLVKWYSEDKKTFADRVVEELRRRDNRTIKRMEESMIPQKKKPTKKR